MFKKIFISHYPIESGIIIMDPVEEFSNTLAALLSVKPPGVSGTKIRKLTELAVQNVQVNICCLGFFFFFN